MKYVLDTNIVARLLDADERVLSHLTDIEPSDVGIPLLVLAELLFGVEKSGRREQNRARVQRLTEAFPILQVGLAVVRAMQLYAPRLKAWGDRRATSIC